MTLAKLTLKLPDDFERQFRDRCRAANALPAHRVQALERTCAKLAARLELDPETEIASELPAIRADAMSRMRRTGQK